MASKEILVVCICLKPTANAFKYEISSFSKLSDHLSEFSLHIEYKIVSAASYPQLFWLHDIPLGTSSAFSSKVTIWFKQIFLGRTSSCFSYIVLFIFSNLHFLLCYKFVLFWENCTLPHMFRRRLLESARVKSWNVLVWQGPNQHIYFGRSPAESTGNQHILASV